MKTRKICSRCDEHQEPIETFGANSSYESLHDAVGLWRAKRRTNDLDPIAAEHVVETVSEFLIPVPNQEPERFRALRQCPCQVAGLLRHPQVVWIRSAPGEIHSATGRTRPRDRRATSSWGSSRESPRIGPRRFWRRTGRRSDNRIDFIASTQP